MPETDPATQEFPLSLEPPSRRKLSVLIGSKEFKVVDTEQARAVLPYVSLMGELLIDLDQEGLLPVDTKGTVEKEGCRLKLSREASKLLCRWDFRYSITTENQTEKIGEDYSPSTDPDLAHLGIAVPGRPELATRKLTITTDTIRSRRELYLVFAAAIATKDISIVLGGTNQVLGGEVVIKDPKACRDHLIEAAAQARRINWLEHNTFIHYYNLSTREYDYYEYSYKQKVKKTAAEQEAEREESETSIVEKVEGADN